MAYWRPQFRSNTWIVLSLCFVVSCKKMKWFLANEIGWMLHRNRRPYGGHSFWGGPVYSRNRCEKTIQICKAGYMEYSFITWNYNNPWTIDRSQPTLESDNLRSNGMNVIAPFSISGAQFYLQQSVSKESSNYISQCLHVFIWHSEMPEPSHESIYSHDISERS